MNIERLTKMVELLRRIDEDRKLASAFDLSSWLFVGGGFSKDIAGLPLSQQFDEFKRHDCGTTACAIGFAAMDPWFNEQGLRFHEGGVPHYVVDGYAVAHSFGAAAEFFDVPYRVAQEFFSMRSYATEDKTAAWQVADRIEAYMKENGHDPR